MQKITFYALALVMAVSTPACAQTKKSISASGSVEVLEATRQTTNPGRREMEPFTIYRFRIIWKSKSTPTSFFWKPDATAWMETHIAKPIKIPGLAPGDVMVIERNITAKEVHYGDTVILTTRRHAHDEEPMPAQVKGMPASGLFYQTSAAPSNWQRTAITIRKLPDMNMP